MKDVRMIVKNKFEKRVAKIFGLVFPDKKYQDIWPDLISKDGSFLVEVKASSYVNGGVINKKQLNKFDKQTNKRRFYAFPYHSITKDMGKNYPTKKALEEALDLKSLFLLPFSIVKSHFDNSHKRETPHHDTFVQLIESKAENIFGGNKKTWTHLKLCYDYYKPISPHKRIHILTKNGYLEEKILSSFNYN
jgi:hypothetical protein